jgi:hypothetical protein
MHVSSSSYIKPPTIIFNIQGHTFSKVVGWLYILKIIVGDFIYEEENTCMSYEEEDILKMMVGGFMY